MFKLGGSSSLLGIALINEPRYILLIHGPLTEQLVVCTEFPKACVGHPIPGHVRAEVRQRGSWTHPSGDFTIRVEGIYRYPDRYVFVIRRNDRTIVDIVIGFPGMVMGIPIPPGLKAVVDRQGHAYDDGKTFFILKEGYCGSNDNSPPASPPEDQANGSGNPGGQELRRD